MASKLVAIIVFVLHLIAFGLAVAAEKRRSKAHEETDANSRKYCVYSSDIATGLGVGALLFLLAGHLLIMVVSRCLCCGSGLRPGGSRACAVTLFFLTWLTFIVAEACLLAGSARNAYHTKYWTYISSEPIPCKTVRKGVFAAGAACTVLTAIMSQIYYMSYAKASSFSTPPPPRNSDNGVRMGAL